MPTTWLQCSSLNPPTLPSMKYFLISIFCVQLFILQFVCYLFFCKCVLLMIIYVQDDNLKSLNIIFNFPYAVGCTLMKINNNLSNLRNILYFQGVIQLCKINCLLISLIDFSNINMRLYLNNMKFIDK